MVEEDDPRTPYEGTILDLSEHGVRVEAEAALTPGQTLSLIQSDNPTRTLRCMVVWAGDVGSDGHDQAGLEFLKPSSPALEN